MEEKKGFTIAVSGKGGVGKTMLSALLVKNLSQSGSVLAIDADPDANLAEALGMEVKKNIGEVRENIAETATRIPRAGDTSPGYEAALHGVIEETDDFDLIVMGRSEGAGCYCAINIILRQVIDGMATTYDFTVIDCEAGLEHLSRRTTRQVDLMIVVTEPTRAGILTAVQVQKLAKEVSANIGQILVVGNKISPETRPVLDRVADQNNLKPSAYIPSDPQLALLEMDDKPVIQLPDDSPASKAVAELCQEILGAASLSRERV